MMKTKLQTAAILAAILALSFHVAPPAFGADNLDPTVGETAWGNFVADSMREHYKCDVAFIDAGTLSTLTTKEAISESITRLEIAEVEVVTAKLTGRDLALVLNNSLKFFPRKSNGFLQVSGMVITVDPKLAANKVVAASVGGAALDPAKTYTVAMTKFLANGGAGFNVLDDIPVVDGSVRFVGELIADYYIAHPEMPKVGGRYVVRG
ncbi:MAG: 5'-nucleotidase C-terminal domain-containing protein [bacterium]|jgi:2',3'-cyclic-nucleotide 2'-phosphodiesterase (5'-nucleotidase family)